jgi:hypothetical protein
MTDDRPIGVMEHLARLPHSLSIPISAALGLSGEGSILQVFRFVDAVDFVLRFVVAHGAGVAYRAGTPIALGLPDHPSIFDWEISAGRLAKAVESGALPNWGGQLVITALTKAMDSDCREATKRAGLGGLYFRELRNWIFHGGGVGLTKAGSEVLVRELVPIIESITAALGQ